jgi:hypothetical protein
MLKVNPLIVIVPTLTLLLVGSVQGQGWEDPVIASAPDQGDVFGASTFRTSSGRVIVTWLEDIDGPNTSVPHFGEMTLDPPPGWASPWTSAVMERPLIEDPGVGGMTADEESRTSCVAWDVTGPGGEPEWLRVWVAWTKKVLHHPAPRVEIWLTGALLDDQWRVVEETSSRLSRACASENPWIDARDPVVALEEDAAAGKRKLWVVWREVREDGGPYQIMVKRPWNVTPVTLPSPDPLEYTNCLGTACTIVDGLLWVGGIFYRAQGDEDYRVPFSAPFSLAMFPEDWHTISSTDTVNCTELVMATRQAPGLPEQPCAHYLTWDEAGSGPRSQKVAGSWYALWVGNDWENVPLAADRGDAPFKRAAIAALGESTLACWSRKPTTYEVVAAYSAYDPLNNWGHLGIVPTPTGAEREPMSWGALFGPAGGAEQPTVLWSQRLLDGELTGTWELWSCTFTPDSLPSQSMNPRRWAIR